MWNSKELKQTGKRLFERNYVQVLIASIIVYVLGGNFVSVSTTNESTMGYHIPVTLTVGPLSFNNMFAITVGTIMLIGLISLIFGLFVGNIIEIGECYFYIKNRHEENVSCKEVFFPFQSESYIHFVLAQLEIILRVALWTLLLIVPGIIKSYEYYMTSYLLAEHPELTTKQAMNYSTRMMDGHKWDAFMLITISFLPWIILDIFTGGLAGIVYVSPYQKSTKTELYYFLKHASGIDIELGDYDITEINQTELFY